MYHSWVVDQDYPEGHLVEMTTEEQAQLERDRALHAATSAAQGMLEDAAAARVADLRKARTELADGVIFASLSTSEKRVIDTLLESLLVS